MIQEKSIAPLLRLCLDIGPLAVFFVAYRAFGLMAATGALVAATLVSLLIGYLLTRKVPLMPVITAVAVAAFGGMTLYMHDEMFIKMKPTFVNLFFAAALLVGNAYGRPMLKYLLGGAIHLTPEGWRTLGNRWGVFFIGLAGLNEVIWRNFSTAFWVDFKVFGMLSLTLLFTCAQLPLLKRAMIHPEEP